MVVYHFGDYRLDEGLKQLYCGTEPIRLSRRPWRALHYLITHRDRVVPRRELQNAVWGEDVYISDSTVDVCLGQVRTAVGDSGKTQHTIWTQHGWGWHFIAKVEERHDPSCPPSQPWHGSLTLYIWDPDAAARRRVPLAQRGVLPLRAGDRIRVEAALNRPTYVYLLWVDTEGRGTPVFPWHQGDWARRPAGPVAL